MSDKEKFPCLMIHPRSGLVVKMESRRGGDNGVGTVVGSGNGISTSYVVGSHSSTWAIDNFRLFTGDINGNER